MRHQRDVDFHDPLEAVSAGGAKHQLGLEVRVVQERPLERFKVLDVVEIQTEVAAVFHQLVVGPLAEHARERAVCEVSRLVLASGVLVFDGTKFLGLRLGVVAGDVVPDIEQRDGLVRRLVRDRCLEEGERRERLHRDCVAVVGAVTVLEVKIQVFVDGDEQILSVFLPVQLGEIEAVAFRDCIELVLVTGDFVGEFLLGVNLLRPDVQRLAAVSEGIPADSAVTTDDFHHGLTGVELTQDVGVDARTVMRLGQDGFLTYHSEILHVWR